jgi:hypothetical protein
MLSAGGYRHLGMTPVAREGQLDLLGDEGPADD